MKSVLTWVLVAILAMAGLAVVPASAESDAFELMSGIDWNDSLSDVLRKLDHDSMCNISRHDEEEYYNVLFFLTPTLIDWICESAGQEIKDSFKYVVFMFDAQSDGLECVYTMIEKHGSDGGIFDTIAANLTERYGVTPGQLPLSDGDEACLKWALPEQSTVIVLRNNEAFISFSFWDDTYTW